MLLEFLVYGLEIKSNIDTGSKCILQIFWENWGLKRQKNASLCMIYALFWTLADKTTLPNIVNNMVVHKKNIQLSWVC